MTTTEDLTTEKHIHQIIVPVRYPDPAKRSLIDRILRRPVPETETERTLTFYPSYVCSQYRIAEACTLLPDEIWQAEYMNLPLLLQHQPTVVYIIAAALQNDHLEPEKKLIKFLERNLSGEQLHESLAASVQALNLESFLKCLVLLKPAAKILTGDVEPSEQLTDLTNLND